MLEDINDDICKLEKEKQLKIHVNDLSKYNNLNEDLQSKL
jgi:hypothetical protein